MNITADLFKAHLKCPTKCLLRSLGESGTGNTYADWVRTQSETYRNAGIKRLANEYHNGDCVTGPLDDDLKATKWKLGINLVARGKNLESAIHAVERIPPEGRGQSAQFIPIRFMPTNILTKDDKLLLAFDAMVLSEALGREVSVGKIIHGDDHAVLKVKTSALEGAARKQLSKITALLSDSAPPNLVLNRHCAECDFRDRCLPKAIEKDDLSLLDRMTPKLAGKYQKKGIFTIEQLSYLFRPRKNKKRPPALRFSPELQALAIRTNKTYIQEVPNHKRSSVELFLDFEGIPDERFNYLIGLLTSDGQSATYRSFWADSKADEQKMWKELIEATSQHPDSPIYHYGNYESKAVKDFIQQYGTSSDITGRLVNVNSWIYGKVYFPVRSNSLKALGKYLGASWTTPNASGLTSLVWRQRWEENGDGNYKQLLLTYNEEDCRALRLLVETVSGLKDNAESHPTVELASSPKRQATKIGNEIHGQFDWICKSARAEYDRNKINIRNPSASQNEKKGPGLPKGHQGYRRIIPKRVDRIIRIRTRRKCPRCRPSHDLQHTGRVAEKTIIDLVFTKHGCKKAITRYEGEKSRCTKLLVDYNPNGIAKLGGFLFGHAFQAWSIHQKIVLRLPYDIIIKVMEDMFGESMSVTSIVSFIGHFSKIYAATERFSVQRLLESPFIHADETRLNIQGVDHYVWVFTDGIHVVFRMTETREANIVHEFLKGYKGVLVSDFYAGYDSVPCPQQKCLVHLIRDLNEVLWENPFNHELEAFVFDTRNLLVPIFEAVDKYGLKKRHLNKFDGTVERFYNKTIVDRVYESEIIRTFQKRFQRYRESLFRFLTQDNLPWNNNMAERAIRELAVQRKISGTFYKRVAPQYLLLLGIAQTCRFQEKSFLKFLVSKEKDVDAFRAAKRKRFSTPTTSKENLRTNLASASPIILPERPQTAMTPAADTPETV